MGNLVHVIVLSINGTIKNNKLAYVHQDLATTLAFYSVSNIRINELE